MTRIPKVMLAVSLAAFAVGSVVTFGYAEVPPGWTVAMPVGAVFLGLFLVTLTLQNEAARFDEEERARLTVTGRHVAKKSANVSATAVTTASAHFTPAHSN
ncbi:MAG TPA: hypothetical protein VN887_12995 [Candidatus Angelobacter sp.]|nr:hypothetical protein [Candidatus Angelobacter sp.]